MTERLINPENRNTPAYWDREYEQGYIYGLHPSETALKTARFLIDNSLVGPEVTLLEIGSGYGRNSSYFDAQLGTKTTSLDFSPRAVKMGIELVKKQGSSVKFLEGDVTQLSKYVKDNFDVIFHNFCLHIFSEAQRSRIYAECSRHLHPHGLFMGSYLSVNDPDCPKRQDDNGLTKVIRGKPQHFFTERELRDELAPYFDIEVIKETRDPERIIHVRRNTTYFFVVGERK